MRMDAGCNTHHRVVAAAAAAVVVVGGRAHPLLLLSLRGHTIVDVVAVVAELLMPTPRVDT